MYNTRMKTIILLLTAAAFALMLLSACSRARFDFTFSDELTEVKAIANARRDAITRPAIDEALRLIDLHTPGEIDVFDPIFYINCAICWATLPHFNPTGFCTHAVIHGVWEDNILLPTVYDISQDQAIQDVELFFAILASSYGMYHYLGGDAVFLPILSEIISTLKTQENWDVDDFAHLLHSSLLPYVIDHHFLINNITFPRNYEVFASTMKFQKNEYGFHYNGVYVYSIILPCRPDFSQEIDTILRLSMDETGAIFYYTPVFILCTRTGNAPEVFTILYTDGTQETVPLELVINYRRGAEPPTLEFIQGIPVVTVERMPSHLNDGRYVPNREETVQFLHFATQLQDEPVIIIDLRYNHGGLGIVPLIWFNMLMGENIPSSYIELRIISEARHAEIMGPPYVPSYMIGRYFRPRTRVDNYRKIQTYPPHRIVPHDQLIILLTGRRTFSTSERMVDLALNMRNTLVIGQNTGGLYTTARNSWQPALPNSRIRFEFSVGMHIFPDGHFREGVGFAPDIWVNGCALTAALGMIEHHVQW